MFFLPGYPEIHRVTKNGTHYIDGELLENSVFGKDPFEPVNMSYIPDIIKKESDVAVEVLKRSEKIPELAKDQPEIIVCDTVSTEDIDNRLDELIEERSRAVGGVRRTGRSSGRKNIFQPARRDGISQD